MNEKRNNNTTKTTNDDDEAQNRKSTNIYKKDTQRERPNRCMCYSNEMLNQQRKQQLSDFFRCLLLLFLVAVVLFATFSVFLVNNVSMRLYKHYLVSRR